jgi:hypothetical protein
MIEENLVYFAMNGLGWRVACAFVVQPWRGWASVRALAPRPGRGWWLYVLWLAPNLVMLFLVHGPKVGYWLLSFPPILLVIASWAERGGEDPGRGVRGQARLRWLPAAMAGALVGAAISYFPYGALLGGPRWAVDYLLYRSAPRLALDLDASQRRLDAALRGLARFGAPQPFVCVRGFAEAPNIRTVTYDFAYVPWVTADAARTDPRSIPASAYWLFDWRGPNPALRALFPRWRRVEGDRLFSLWEASREQPVVEIPRVRLRAPARGPKR